MESEDRRKADENFKFKIVEQHAEIKALLSSSNAQIRDLSDDLKTHSMAISEIRWALWGGPKESDIGLLEKHRKLARNWTIAVSVCAFAFSALGKIVSPLYEKAVADWAYHSVGTRWMVEQRRTKVRKYIIHQTIAPPDPTPSDP